ncbi:MAG: hypothetical protein ACRDJG_01505, partial [Actinomycetota bacterium]
MPFGKQFSPEQINLHEVLELAATANGDCRQFQELILARYFSTRPTSRGKLAMNTRIAMQQYGLLDAHCQLTKVGRQLEAMPDGSKDLYEGFARHILLDCHGAQLLQAVATAISRNVALTAPNIAEQLAMMGIDAGGRSGEKLNPMRLWLEKVGVFRKRWEIDEIAVERILGTPPATIEVLAGLTWEQRQFLAALTSILGPEKQYSSAEVARLAEQRSSIRYDLKQLPKKVLFPLESAGFLATAKTTIGRGAKPYLVQVTELGAREVLEPLLRNLAGLAEPLDSRVLRRSLGELLAEVRNPSLGSDRRGKALEGVALQVILALGLRFARWRKRANETGGAEVDLAAFQTNGRFSVWQVQCKVSAMTGREAVDREMGVARLLRSNVIAFVSAGSVGTAPRKAAESYMRATGVNLIFVDGADLDAIARGIPPAKLIDQQFLAVEKIRGPRPANTSRCG